MSPEQRDQTLITDLPQRVIGGKVSTIDRKGHWRVIEYELEKIGAGRALVGSQPGFERDPTTGPLTIRLGARGHHRISFVTRYGPVRAKLTGEKCFSVCEPINEGLPKLPTAGSVEGWFDAEEVLWRQADLTGRDLIIDDRDPGTILLAIRLTPVEPADDAAEVRWPSAFEGGVTLGERMYRSPDELFEWFERVPNDSCAKLALWECVAGDSCMYFTKVGTQFGDPAMTEFTGDPVREHDVIFTANMQQYREWGVDPLNAMVEYAHGRGWELYVYIRYRNYHDVWSNRFGASRFYLEHPEYHLAGPDGEHVMGLSVAYDQVRRHLCELYVEMANYGIDGICLGFNRGVPVVLYEQAMVKGFMSEYGQDPRKLPQRDPRWLDYTANVVTHFMRQVKDALGTKCRLSALVWGTEELNRRYGLDTAAWVADGIVDDLFTVSARYCKWCIHPAGTSEDLDFEYFQNLPGRQNVRLWPTLYMWQQFAADPVGQAGFLQECLDAGADGYAFWDAPMHSPDLQANVWDLGKMPRPAYRKTNRLLGKYEMINWDGYRWNRFSPVASW